MGWNNVETILQKRRIASRFFICQVRGSCRLFLSEGSLVKRVFFCSSTGFDGGVDTIRKKPTGQCAAVGTNSGWLDTHCGDLGHIFSGGTENLEIPLDVLIGREKLGTFIYAYNVYYVKSDTYK